jgi:hypothetical protein
MEHGVGVAEGGNLLAEDLHCTQKLMHFQGFDVVAEEVHLYITCCLSENQYVPNLAFHSTAAHIFEKKSGTSRKFSLRKTHKSMHHSRSYPEENPLIMCTAKIGFLTEHSASLLRH